MAEIQCSKREVVHMLRNAGFREAADEAMLVLPDPVALARLAEWGEHHGITRDFIVRHFGRNP